MSFLVTEQTAFAAGASPEAVWNLWSDVNCWNQWDDNFKEVTIDGLFKEGSRITIIHGHNPHPTVLLITKLVENRLFHTESDLPFGKVAVQREIKVEATGVNVVHQFHLTPKDAEARSTFMANIATRVAQDFKKAVDNIAELAVTILES